MRFLRCVGPLLVFAGVVAACSDDATTSSGGSAGSVPGTSSGTSGISEPPPQSSSSSGAPGAIDLDSIVSLKISSDGCEKPAGQCLDAQSFAVDFGNSKLITTTCVELAGGGTQDADTSKVLTSAQVDAIKTALGKLATTKFGGSDAGRYDNAKRTLEVTSKSRGTLSFATADTVCPDASSTALASGWQELWDTLRAI